MGWLASIVMRTDAQQGALLNIVVGIIGAMIGGFLLGGPTINSNTFNLTALLVSFIGAVVLLAIVNLVRRGSIRVWEQPILWSEAPPLITSAAPCLSAGFTSGFRSAPGS